MNPDSEKGFTALYLDQTIPVREIARQVGGVRRVYYLAKKYHVPLRKHLSAARREYLRKKLVGGMAHEMPYDRIAAFLDMSDKALENLIAYHRLDAERDERRAKDFRLQ